MWGRLLAQHHVPIDTGKLRNSIKVYKKNDGMAADIKATAKYALYVEYGTGIYNANGNGRNTPWMYRHYRYGWIRTRGQKPRFFMKKAYEGILRDADTILQGVFKWR
jgi:hypothetical protein